MLFRSALSIILIVVMEMFLNRSVKNLNLAALSVMQNLSVIQGCEIEVFNGSSFLRILNAKSGMNHTLFLHDTNFSQP
jgi:hypothetical protein